MSQLFYYTPSGGDWNKALPIGNGKLGAMIFGEEHEEHFQLNEDSVWFGTKRNRNNADARKNLDKIRELILNGKISEAENLCKYALSGTPQSQHSYQTLGDVYFDFCGVQKKQKILSGHSIYQPPYIPQKSRMQTLAFPMKLRLLPTSTQTALLPILRVLIRMGFLWLPPYSVALFMRQPPTQTTRC